MRAFLASLIRKMQKRSAETEEIDGLWVGADKVEHLAVVREALNLIKSHDPRRYARLVGDLEGVWVTLLVAARGRFYCDEYLCELDERFVVQDTVEQVASVIVHEATHARLWRQGVRYEESIRARVEGVCHRQQQLFATKLPANETLSEENDAYLALPEATWSDEARAQKHLKGSVEVLRYLNIPNWLIYATLRVNLARNRWQRQRAKRRLA